VRIERTVRKHRCGRIRAANVETSRLDAVVRWGTVVGYLVLALVMKAPPYFLLARINIVEGSTGWHRAELIRSALAHVSEWWLWAPTTHDTGCRRACRGVPITPTLPTNTPVGGDRWASLMFVSSGFLSRVLLCWPVGAPAQYRTRRGFQCLDPGRRSLLTGSDLHLGVVLRSVICLSLPQYCTNWSGLGGA